MAQHAGDSQADRGAVVSLANQINGDAGVAAGDDSARRCERESSHGRFVDVGRRYLGAGGTGDRWMEVVADAGAIHASH